MIKLWDSIMPYEKDDVDFTPEIKSYPANSRGAVVIFPGGGYGGRAEHEGDVIGEWLQSLGITAFVCEYRVAPYQHPAELSDAQRAVRYVRYNAEKYGFDTDKIAVMGFSAGGHLAASVSTLYDYPAYDKTDEVDEVSARPDASVLCYPVIDMGEYTHEGSRINLLGENATKEMIELMSLQNRVTKDTPEAFIWHTSSDNIVNSMNSMMYCSALQREGVLNELHIYPVGPHGLGIKESIPYVTSWKNDFIKWLELKEWK